MSDSQKVCSKVTRALKKKLKGFPEKFIAVLSLMVSGLVLGKKANMTKIAEELPTKAKDKSTFRRFQRFVANDNIDYEEYHMPFAQQIVQALGVNRLVVAIDSSVVGKGCVTLMAGVAYRNRLLPLAWIVYEGSKGHTTAERHIQVLQLLERVIPEEMDVILVGDGEFDNVPMLEWLEENTNWNFAVRTCKSSQVTYNGERYRIDTIAEKGHIVFLEETYFTAQEFGPLMAFAWWDENCDEAIYLITSLTNVDEACGYYRKRALIETFFSDQKSRGFGIDKSRISDPQRLERLLLGAFIAYIWMIWLGVEVVQKGYTSLIDTARGDKSIFSLGVTWLKNRIKYGEHFDVSFEIQQPPIE
ncbi:MAG: IS4 family transposase [Cyclobacteriaceae bacterium]|nr:IS4 family transposase [Cyclobacteriaceae bacterium]